MNALIKRIIAGLLVMVSLTCSAPYQLASTLISPQPAATSTSSASPPAQTLAAPEQISPTGDQPTATQPAAPPLESLPDQEGAACSYNPVIANLLEGTNSEQWLAWVAMLSGAEPVRVDGGETRIETRFSPALFNGQSNARAFDWLQEQLAQWYPAQQIEVQPYEVVFDEQHQTWKNLILTLPGKTHPDEIVVLSAHLDSTSSKPYRLAPGAEDNASGSATLLEAARLFRTAQFERTLMIVWFTGEEQGLYGSQAFVQEAQSNKLQFIGALNLDMFGYDSDQDRCFELHVGTLPESQAIGKCFQNSIQSYQPDLKADFITTEAIDRSDHGSFWDARIGAVEVLENLFDNKLPAGCANRDASPYYHSDQDVVANLNVETAFAIARASLAAAAGLARPLDR